MRSTYHTRPVPNGECERVLRELDGDLGEGELAVEGEPRIVETEAHEWEQEVELLVHLGLGIPAWGRNVGYVGIRRRNGNLGDLG